MKELIRKIASFFIYYKSVDKKSRRRFERTSLNFLILLVIFLSVRYKLTKITSNPEITIGYITEYGHESMEHMNAYYKFYVAGKEYNINQSVRFKTMIGEQYMVMYQKDNPSRAMILTDKPIF